MDPSNRIYWELGRLHNTCDTNREDHTSLREDHTSLREKCERDNLINQERFRTIEVTQDSQQEQIDSFQEHVNVHLEQQQRQLQQQHSLLLLLCFVILVLVVLVASGWW